MNANKIASRIGTTVLLVLAIQGDEYSLILRIALVYFAIVMIDGLANIGR